MRNIVTSIFMSVDGVVDADSDWQYPYFDGQLFEEIGDDWEGASTVLLGKHSYQGYDKLRSEHPDSPALAFLDGAERHVVTSDPHVVDGWPGTNALSGDQLDEAITSMKSAEGKNILLMGSPTLLVSLLPKGYIDEFKIMLIPAVVGSGKKLFHDSATIKSQGFKVSHVKRLDSGVIIVSYKP